MAKTPYRTVTRQGESDPVSDAEKSECVDESILVENKVKQLLDDICTQQKKIEGASKALNLCQSTIEFNGSSEHVGGEWALLVASKFSFLYYKKFNIKLYFRSVFICEISKYYEI